MDPNAPDPSRLSARHHPLGSHLRGPTALESVFSLHLEYNHSYDSQLRWSQNDTFLTVLCGFVPPITANFQARSKSHISLVPTQAFMRQPVAGAEKVLIG